MQLPAKFNKTALPSLLLLLPQGTATAQRVRGGRVHARGQTAADRQPG